VARSRACPSVAFLSSSRPPSETPSRRVKREACRTQCNARVSKPRGCTERAAQRRQADAFRAPSWRAARRIATRRWRTFLGRADWAHLTCAGCARRAPLRFAPNVPPADELCRRRSHAHRRRLTAAASPREASTGCSAPMSPRRCARTALARHPLPQPAGR
jgi:hypothetical protein